MRRRLIVNADGFGFTYGNNRGILECCAARVVRSVSVNANFPAVEDTPELLEQFPDVSVGVHMNLSVGSCVSDPLSIPDLVDEQGTFLGPELARRLIRKQVPFDQMVRELSAQVERLQSYGARPSHWDGHQNQHLYPGYFDAALEVGLKYGIQRMRTHYHHLFAMGGGRWCRAAWHLLTHPKRAATYTVARAKMRRARRAGMRMADRLISPGLIDSTRKFDKRFWLELFRTLPEGTSEVYCHPGYPDDTLRSQAKYVEKRAAELEILREPALAEAACQCGVELISFNEL